MSAIKFPRPRDAKGHAWGLHGAEPIEVWERFSPAYEAQIERVVRVLERHGFKVEINGAGDEDGEYVLATRSNGRTIFQHFENPQEANRLAAMSDSALERWIALKVNASGFLSRLERWH